VTLPLDAGSSPRGCPRARDPMIDGSRPDENLVVAANAGESVVHCAPMSPSVPRLAKTKHERPGGWVWPSWRASARIAAAAALCVIGPLAAAQFETRSATTLDASGM